MSAPARALGFLLLAAGACSGPAAKDEGGGQPAADDPFHAAKVAQGLEPFAQFLGDWEGSAENVAGNFTVAKRFQWLVPDSWMLEQTVSYSPETGGEVARTALLYTFDPALGAVIAEQLEADGAQRRLYMYTSDAGASWELRPEPAGEAQFRFATTLFSASEWQADSFERNAGGAWQAVEHMTLRRKH